MLVAIALILTLTAYELLVRSVIRRTEPGGEALENQWNGAAVRHYRAAEPSRPGKGRAVVHRVRPPES
ncbi:hypothetical protein GCM10010307_29160 [Streptomyces vastus]|uniref:Uncharacterized protein n=1 Tax=Streptomyces vastus TaxID=285451 RepID=A0ABN3QSN3_9ACTN